MRVFSRVLPNGFYIEEGLRVDTVKTVREFVYNYNNTQIYGLYAETEDNKNFVLVTTDAANIMYALLQYGYVDASNCTRIEAAKGQYDVVGLSQYCQSNAAQFIQ